MLRRVQSLADEMNDVVTYELANGSRISVDRRALEDMGLETFCRLYIRGEQFPKDDSRDPVFQDGRQIGTVPAWFDPRLIKSKNLIFYEPRRGDFTPEGDGWKADRSLGPGDLEAIPGFVWEREP